MARQKKRLPRKKIKHFKTKRFAATGNSYRESEDGKTCEIDVVISAGSPVYEDTMGPNGTMIQECTILDISEEGIRMDRLLGKAAPVLDNHHTGIGGGGDIPDSVAAVQKGRVVNAWIEDTPEGKVLMGTLLLSRVTQAEIELAEKVRNGTIAGVSVGADVHSYQEVDASDERVRAHIDPAANNVYDNNIVYTYIDDWEPYEVSLVTIPADPKAIVRSAKKRSYTMARSFDEKQLRRLMLSTIEEHERRKKKKIKQEAAASAIVGAVIQQLASNGDLGDLDQETLAAAVSDLAVEGMGGGGEALASLAQTKEEEEEDDDKKVTQAEEDEDDEDKKKEEVIVAAEDEEEKDEEEDDKVTQAKEPKGGEGGDEDEDDEKKMTRAEEEAEEEDEKKQLRAWVKSMFKKRGYDISTGSRGLQRSVVPSRNYVDSQSEIRRMNLIRRKMEDALAYKITDGEWDKNIEKNKYVGQGMLTLGRELLVQRGYRDAHLMSEMNVYNMLMTPGRIKITRGGGPLASSGDFADLLTNVIDKTVLSSYNELRGQQTFDPFVKRRGVKDFKTVDMVALGESAKLKLVPPGSPAPQFSMSDIKESLEIKTYQSEFTLTRQAFINDDTSQLQAVLSSGVAAAELESNMVYNELENGLFQGQAVFSAANKNLTTGYALNKTGDPFGGLKMLRQKFKKQTMMDSDSPMNLLLGYLIVPAELETDAEQIQAQLTPRLPQEANVTGITRWQLICDGRLTSASNYYGIAREINKLRPFMYLVTLDGQSGPDMTFRMVADNDSMKWKTSYDLAAKIVSYRLAQKVTA